MSQNSSPPPVPPTEAFSGSEPEPEEIDIAKTAVALSERLKASSAAHRKGFKDIERDVGRSLGRIWDALTKPGEARKIADEFVETIEKTQRK